MEMWTIGVQIDLVLNHSSCITMITGFTSQSCLHGSLLVCRTNCGGFCITSRTKMVTTAPTTIRCRYLRSICRVRNRRVCIFFLCSTMSVFAVAAIQRLESLGVSFVVCWVGITGLAAVVTTDIVTVTSAWKFMSIFKYKCGCQRVEVCPVPR